MKIIPMQRGEPVAELARTVRECLVTIQTKIAAQQLGEAFKS